jgi:hypothetical protein
MTSLPQRLRDSARDLPNEPVTLAQLAQAHGAALPGSMLVLLAAPCVLPIPGIGNVMGTALAVLALAGWQRGEVGELSGRVAQVRLPAHWARRILHLLAWFYAGSGRLCRARLAGMTELRPRSWMSPLVGLMGGLIFLPIPLGNVLPAAATVLLGLGLAFRDGLATLAGCGVALLAVAYTVALGVGAWSWLLAPVVRWSQA